MIIFWELLSLSVTRRTYPHIFVSYIKNQKTTKKKKTTTKNLKISKQKQTNKHYKIVTKNGRDNLS